MPALEDFKFDDLNQLSELAKTEYLARKGEIEKRLNYYDGIHKKWLIDPVTKEPTSENVTINLVKKIIDQTTSFLFGDSPDITTGDKTTDGKVEALEDANQDDLFYTNIGESGSIAGHVFVKLVPDDEKGVRWVRQNPALVTAFWSPEDGQRAIAYKIEWSVGKVDYRQDIIFDSNTNQWVIRDLTKTGDNWQRRKEDTIWPYPFSPIVDWQNLPDFTAFYGASDLNALGLNDSVNFTASNINRILKYHAHPKTIGIGIKPSDIQATAVDGLWTVENEAARINNLEMQSDLASSMSYLEFLEGAFYSQQRAVDMTTMKDRIGQLTNFGLRTLFSDALSKNSTKQMLYGYGIKEIIYRSLAIMGVTIEPRNIDVKFKDPLPLNEKEITEMAKLQKESGFISSQTGSEETGHDWLQESVRMAAEKQSQAADLGAALARAMRDQDKNPVVNE